MRCCVLLFAVVALVVTVARAETYILNNSIVVSNVGFDGDMIDLRHVQYSSEKQTSHVFSASQVVGGGLTLQGHLVDYSAINKNVTVTLFDTYVTDATIRVDGYMPHLSTITINSLTAKMHSAQPLFALSSLHLHNSSTLLIRGVTAVWDTQMSDAYVVELTTSGERNTILDNSGLYFLQVAMRNAAGVIYFHTDASLLISDGSTFATDYVSCIGGAEAVVSLLQPVTVASSSTFRITNVAAGALPLLKAAANIEIADTSLLLLSSSNTSGKLLSVTGTVSVTGASVATFKDLRGLSSGATSLTPSVVDTTSMVYGRGCVINGVELQTAASYHTQNINVATLVTSDGYRPGTQVCAYEQCLPGHYDTSAPQLAGCACTCNQRSQAPYCTLATDPVAAFITNMDKDAICSVPNCASCPALPSACTFCATGYTLSNDGYCVRQSPPPTTTGAPTNPPGPQPLPPELCSLHCIICETACFGCSTPVCRACETGYLLQGVAICVKQFSGVPMTTAIPATLGMLLLGAAVGYAG